MTTATPARVRLGPRSLQTRFLAGTVLVIVLMMVAVIVLMLVGVALSAMIWRLQAYLLRWQQHNMVE